MLYLNNSMKSQPPTVIMRCFPTFSHPDCPSNFRVNPFNKRVIGIPDGDSCPHGRHGFATCTEKGNSAFTIKNTSYITSFAFCQFFIRIMKRVTPFLRAVVWKLSLQTEFAGFSSKSSISTAKYFTEDVHRCLRINLSEFLKFIRSPMFCSHIKQHITKKVECQIFQGCCNYDY